MSGGKPSRNYPDNPYPYRPDSNFLYFFSHPETGSAALFDPQDSKVTLFLNERRAAGALWYGAVPAFDAMHRRHGVAAVLGVSTLEMSVKKIAGSRQVAGMAVADATPTPHGLVCFTYTQTDGDWPPTSRVNSEHNSRAESPST